MKRHLLFAFILLIALVVSIASFIPFLIGDCGANTMRQRALEGCLKAQSREVDLFAIVWLITLVHLIWQHARRSRHVFVSYFMFVILPVASAVILGQSQAKQWQSLDRTP